MADMKGHPIVKSPTRNTADSDAMKLLRATRDGVLFGADYLINLAMQGRIFYGSDADFNDTIAGTTTLANTTPMILLDVPAGTTAIPLGFMLTQTGTVAGGEITVIVEIDNAGRFSSGGTSQGVLSSRTDMPVTNRCTLYTGPTATNAYGVGIGHYEFIQDVDPAVADDFNWHNFDWKPQTPLLLVGPAAFLVYADAATTAPTYYWHMRWAEIPSSDII